MTSTRTHAFTPASVAAAANRLANRWLIPRLSDSGGGRLGRRLAVVGYVGRRTGRRHQLVTLYVRHGTAVRITVGMPEHKTWWRNFEDPRPVRLRLNGVDYDAVAHVDREGDRVSVVAELSPPG